MLGLLTRPSRRPLGSIVHKTSCSRTRRISCNVKRCSLTEGLGIQRQGPSHRHSLQGQEMQPAWQQTRRRGHHRPSAQRSRKHKPAPPHRNPLYRTQVHSEVAHDHVVMLPGPGSSKSLSRAGSALSRSFGRRSRDEDELQRVALEVAFEERLARKEARVIMAAATAAAASAACAASCCHLPRSHPRPSPILAILIYFKTPAGSFSLPEEQRRMAGGGFAPPDACTYQGAAVARLSR